MDLTGEQHERLLPAIERAASECRSEMAVFIGIELLGRFCANAEALRALTRLSQHRRTEVRALVPMGLRELCRHSSTHLEKAIAALPTGARNVLVLHDVHGFEHAEIAAALGVAVGTCKAQLHRARKLVKEALSW